MPLFLIFLIIPLIEIWLFMTIGDEIGIGMTFALCVITAIIGSGLVRNQGINTLNKARSSMNQGEMPVQELFDGICIAIAGATLITPGFFTDTIGFLLLLPPFRAWLRHYIKNNTRIFMQSSSSFTSSGNRGRTDSSVIEGEFVEIKDTDSQIKPKDDA